MKNKIRFLSVLLLFSTISLAQTDAPAFWEACKEELPENKTRCSEKAIIQFVSEQLKYPQAALEAKTEGTVVIRFEIDAEGKVLNPKIVRDLENGCGQEALRVVKNLPNFSPAIKDDAPIKTSMNLPVRFKIAQTKERYQLHLQQIEWGTHYSDDITNKDIETLLDNNMPLIVRSANGNEYPIESLQVTIVKNKVETSINEPISTFNKAMKKMLRKAKGPAEIYLLATMQDGTGKKTVERRFVLQKNK
jgi:TonB family protein